MLNVTTMMVHTHANVTLVSVVWTVILVRTSMSAKNPKVLQIDINVMQMLNVSMQLVHTNVTAMLDSMMLTETAKYAKTSMNAITTHVWKVDYAKIPLVITNVHVHPVIVVTALEHHVKTSMNVRTVASNATPMKNAPTPSALTIA